MKRRPRILVTGSSGLIGSEVCSYFGRRGFAVHGLDNNQRAVFFGPAADTRFNQARLARELPRFTHHELDVRDRAGVLGLVRRVRPDATRKTSRELYLVCEGFKPAAPAEEST